MQILTISCTDDVVSIGVADASSFVVGNHVHIFNTGHNKLDGGQTLLDVDTDTDIVQYTVNNQDDITEFAPANAVIVSQVTWIDADNIADYQGWTLDEAENTSIDICVDAANEWAYQRRYAAGYCDNPTVVPGEAVKLGTILYAVALFNEKGALDQIPSFSDLPTPAPAGSMGQIMRLLGVGRGRIG